MAYIYKRGKYFWVGYKQGGRQVQKSLKVTSKAAARDLLGEYQTIEAKYHNRSRVLSTRKKIEDVVKEYSESKAREKTRNWYKWCGDQFVEFCRGRGIENVADVHADTVEDFYAYVKKEARKKFDEAKKEAEEKKKRPPKQRSDPGGAGSILRGVKAVLNYAVKLGHIPENPARHVKPDKATRKLFRDLSFDEMDRLLAALEKHSKAFFPMFATAYYAGLREGELIYLRPGDVNLKQNYLDVKSKSENQIKDHQERRIPLNGKLRAILKGHKPGKEWLFETAPGKPRKNNLNRELRRVAENIGIDTEGLHMRVLRESFGSHLRRRGVDIALISQYMGHSSIDVTLRHYAHIPIEETHKEIDLL